MTSPQKSRSQRQVTAAGYAALVKRVLSELSELEFFVKRRTAESYWKVGKFIHEHLLQNKERADYGQTLYERLAADVDRDKSTLMRSVQFYRAYPILARGRQLSWSHYRALMSVQDDGQRRKLEKEIIEKNWAAEKFQKYLTTKRELEIPADKEKPIVQLKFTRGRLNTFGVLEPAAGKEVVLDLGFRVHKNFPQGKGMRLKAGDCVEADGAGVSPRFKKTSAKKEELFAYQAKIAKIIDGDTLSVVIGLGFGITIDQKLRLRGIDCPEIDTDEGKAAKRFVEARLKDLEFIVIKTHKDTTDKYDRYLADVFYAESLQYLNQELLDNKLAVPF